MIKISIRFWLESHKTLNIINKVNELNQNISVNYDFQLETDVKFYKSKSLNWIWKFDVKSWKLEENWSYETFKSMPKLTGYQLKNNLNYS